jgi:hypothetical protein
MCVAIAVAGMVTCGAAAGSPAPARDTGEASTVFRPDGTPGGLRQEFERLAARNPRITKLVTIGETHRGQEIVALKVTRRAAQLRDGRQPAILYIGGQHAREWITHGDGPPARAACPRRLRGRPRAHRPGRLRSCQYPAP